VAPRPARGLPTEARYVLIGLGNTAFGYALFIALELLLGAAVGYLVVLVLAHTGSVLFSFVTQRTWVFRVTGPVLRDLWRFYVVQLAALAANAVTLAFCVEVLGLPVVPAQLLAAGTVVAATFYAHRSFSFRRPPVATRPEVP
jgi:putative flippase GtrA